MRHSILVVAGLILAGCVSVQSDGLREYDGQGVRGLVAPEPYLSQGRQMVADGRVMVRSIPGDQLARICNDDSPATNGCSLGFTPSGSWCIVYMREGLRDWYLKAAVELHEAAHCAGWPANHPGERNPTMAELVPFL